jgi:hypothetical protein
MISMAVGSLVKIILAHLMVGNRALNIAGAPISTFACDLVIVALNWHFIGKRLPNPAARGEETAARGEEIAARAVSLGIIAKPFFAAFISVGAARLAYSAIEARAGASSLATLATIAFCAVIYLPISLLVGAIEREEIKRILRRREN